MTGSMDFRLPWAIIPAKTKWFARIEFSLRELWVGARWNYEEVDRSDNGRDPLMVRIFDLWLGLPFVSLRVGARREPQWIPHSREMWNVLREMNGEKPHPQAKTLYEYQGAVPPKDGSWPI